MSPAHETYAVEVAGVKRNLRLFEVMQRPADRGISASGSDKVLWYGQERTVDEFLRLMVEEERLVYEFEPVRVYGMYGEVPSR